MKTQRHQGILLPFVHNGVIFPWSMKNTRNNQNIDQKIKNMSSTSSSPPSSLTECLQNTKNAFKFAQLTFGPTLEAVERQKKNFTHLQNQIDNLRKEMKKKLQPDFPSKKPKKKKKPKKHYKHKSIQ